MEEEKSRNGLYLVVTLMVFGGAISFIFGFVIVGETNQYLGPSLMVSTTGIGFVVTGIALILVAATIGIVGGVIFDSRDATVMHLRIVQKLYKHQTVVKESGDELPEVETVTLDWSRNFVKEWPLQITEFQITNAKGENRGKIGFKSLAQETIDYIELEIEYWDYLSRKLEFDEKSVLRGLVNLPPNGATSIDSFLLPDLVDDVQVTLVGVRYKSGEIALMPAEVERYSLPTVTELTGSRKLTDFISSYLEGRGFDVMPTYYYDSTPTHWNCVFCGTINEQRDNSCASCKRERQIQHFAREEFLWKKFEESSST